MYNHGTLNVPRKKLSFIRQGALALILTQVIFSSHPVNSEFAGAVPMSHCIDISNLTEILNKV